jgi:hypothetical protein
MLGLNKTSIEWTQLRHRLTRGGDITKFLVLDLVGMEKNYHWAYFKAFREVLLLFIPSRYHTICGAILECIDRLPVRSPLGVVTMLFNFNSSGHTFTTIINNFTLFFMIVHATVKCTGRFYPDFFRVLEAIIYGDDGVIGITDELAEDCGFSAVGFKDAFADYGIQLKCPDRFMTIDEVDFLSSTWVQYKDYPLYGPSPTRVDKIKLSALVRHRSTGIPDHYMKLAQLRFLSGFNDILWGYLEAVISLFEERHRLRFCRDPVWLSAERLMVSRDLVQQRLVGIMFETNLEVPLVENFILRELGGLF